MTGRAGAGASLLHKKNPRVTIRMTPAPTAAAATPIPAASVREIQALMGLTPEQANVTLQLISLAENGEPRWWNHYGYLERLGDGRGYTATIFGACSGTGDLAMVLDELADIAPGHALLQYRAALKKCKGERVDGIQGMLGAVPRLNGDEAWRRAVWAVYLKLYWKFAAAFAAKTGECARRPGPPLTTALAKGFLVDTAINHGADMGSFRPILDRMDKAADGVDEADEADWLRRFVGARKRLLKSGFQDLDTSGTGDRCALWMRLLKEGNLALRPPIKARAGYWGRGLVVA